MKIATIEVMTAIGPFDRLVAKYADHAWIDVYHARAWMLHSSEGIDVTNAYRQANFECPPSMLACLQRGAAAWMAIAETLVFLDEQGFAENPQNIPVGLRGETLAFPKEPARLLAPLTNPTSLRDFLAFEGHARSGFERRKEPFPDVWYQIPAYYKGNHRSIWNNTDPVPVPYYTQKMDYELEIAAVLGARLKNASIDEAHQAIAGYMLMNDFSARDIQALEVQCRMGPAKGKDFGTAFGPWLLTPEEFHTLPHIRMQAWVNGQQWSDGNLKDAHWSFAEMISYVSQEEELFPGDIFGSGTCNQGCGLELGKFLKPGDVVRLEATGLGHTEHLLVASPIPHQPLQEKYGRSSSH